MTFVFVCKDPAIYLSINPFLSALVEHGELVFSAHMTTGQTPGDEVFSDA